MKLIFSPVSVQDIEDIADYIAHDNHQRAKIFINELEAHCYRIAEMPTAFPKRDDLIKGLRMAIHGNYLILFNVHNLTVRIERIVHGARKLQELF